MDVVGIFWKPVNALHHEVTTHSKNCWNFSFSLLHVNWAFYLYVGASFSPTETWLGFQFMQCQEGTFGHVLYAWSYISYFHSKKLSINNHLIMHLSCLKFCRLSLRIFPVSHQCGFILSSHGASNFLSAMKNKNWHSILYVSIHLTK